MVVAAASAAGGIWLASEALTPKSGVGVSRDVAPIRELPANARNITYYIRPPASYYEFDTDEAGFEEWVGRWHLAWKDRNQGPRTVVTWDHQAGRPGEVLVEDAISYGWWEADAGWFLTYDHRSGRAYCSGNYR
jgi:hypothetical protein